MPFFHEMKHYAGIYAVLYAVVDIYHCSHPKWPEWNHAPSNNVINRLKYFRCSFVQRAVKSSGRTINEACNRRQFSLLSHSALFNFSFYKVCKINPIFHRNRPESRQLHKLEHLWIDTVIWYYYKLLQLGSFNSRSVHIFHSQPNGYHTLFVSGRTRKFHMGLDGKAIALRSSSAALYARRLFAKGNYRFITSAKRAEIWDQISSVIYR